MYTVGAERCTMKFSSFQKTLQENGVVRPFTGMEDVSSPFCNFSLLEYILALVDY